MRNNQHHVAHLNRFLFDELPIMGGCWELRHDAALTCGGPLAQRVLQRIRFRSDRGVEVKTIVLE